MAGLALQLNGSRPKPKQSHKFSKQCWSFKVYKKWWLVVRRIESCRFINSYVIVQILSSSTGVILAILLFASCSSVLLGNNLRAYPCGASIHLTVRPGPESWSSRALKHTVHEPQASIFVHHNTTFLHSFEACISISNHGRRKDFSWHDPRFVFAQNLFVWASI